MTNYLPAGAIGLVRPRWPNLIGQLIRIHQEVPYSHVTVALGNGLCIDQPWYWTRLRTERYWLGTGRVEWWAPTPSFRDEQARVLRSMSYMLEGRIGYSLKGIWDHLWNGSSDRGHRLFCSYLVAELYLTAWDFDFSGGDESPWNVDVARLLQVVTGSDAFTRVATPKQSRRRYVSTPQRELSFAGA